MSGNRSFYPFFILLIPRILPSDELIIGLVFWKLELGFWKLELGFWKLELGFWKLELGFWKLELGFKAANLDLLVRVMNDS